MLIVFLAFTSLLSKAQSTGTISGKLTDPQNNPVEFANVVLLNGSDSTLVKAALSDENGNFIFEISDAGTYLINATQIGFTPYSSVVNFDGSIMQIPLIKMQKGAVELKEASIVASKPLIERQADKTVVNVENTIVNSGTTAIDILKRSPGITVDQDGNISLKGKQGVLVMIDGKPTYLSAADLYTMLRNMRSDELSRRNYNQPIS
ncbi:MAG: carboxypeptidase regulatory-like domain-containing protein [Bacteroidetes bacterium]|nr:carboxypeptidase regulatory-like domain-containing protein [Bacteroidota bacterium]